MTTTMHRRDVSDVERLAAVAAELVVRVRDDDPETNAAWLVGQLPDPADRFRLHFVLAALVPCPTGGPDVARLTRWWTHPPVDPHHVDEVAVARACAGERVVLSAVELHEAITRLDRRTPRPSANAVATTLHVTRRTVVRHRTRQQQQEGAT
jgi:hypothetical protein